jgi:hypothetical protein
VVLIQAIIDGILVGTTYALIGIGFTLIFGVMHKLNLAFAAASITGAFISLVAWQSAKWLPVPLVFLVAALAAGAFGYVIYLTCFRFIPLKSPLATLMATVGMLIFLDEVVTHISDGKAQDYPGMVPAERWTLGPLDLRVDYLLVFVISLVAMLLLLALLYRTRLGIATRAVAQQPVAAQVPTPEPKTVVKRALGLEFSALNDELRRRYRIKAGIKGVVVTGVDRSVAAADQRVQAGDVILEVAGEIVESPADIEKRIEALKKQGKKVALLQVSNGEGETRFVPIPLN